MLASPLSGTIALVNSAIEMKPEMINQDPFGDGWLCEVKLSDWDTDLQHLLDANTYFESMKREALEAQKS